MKHKILHHLGELDNCHIYILTSNMYLDYDSDMMVYRLCTIDPIGMCTITKIMVIELIKMAEIFKIKMLLELED